MARRPLQGTFSKSEKVTTRRLAQGALDTPPRRLRLFSGVPSPSQHHHCGPCLHGRCSDCSGSTDRPISCPSLPPSLSLLADDGSCVSLCHGDASSASPSPSTSLRPKCGLCLIATNFVLSGVTGGDFTHISTIKFVFDSQLLWNKHLGILSLI